MQTLARVLLIVTRIGVFLTPFVPLIVAPSMFFPFITGKAFAFRVIVESIFACWLLLMFVRPEFRPKHSLLLWGVLAFLSVVFLADVLAVNPFKAFWSNFERMEGFIMLAHLGMYFLVACSVLNEEKWWLRFFATSVGVSAFLGIYGLLQLAGKIVINQGGVRLDGTFGNAAYFGGYMLVHIFLTLFLIMRHRVQPWVKWLYGGALALQTVTLYFTATRGAAVGLAAGILLTAALIALGERRMRRLRIVASALVIAVLLGAGGLYGLKNTPTVRNNPTLSRYASISLEAAAPRFMVWRMAFEGVKERPLLGWGQEGFNYVFNKYYDPDMWTQEQWFDRTHNIFLDWLVAAGALGLLSYLSLFAFLLWYLWRLHASSETRQAGGSAEGKTLFSFTESSVLTGLLVAYMIHNFFVFDNLVSYFLFFSLIAYVHAQEGQSFKRLASPLRNPQVLMVSGALLLVGVVASLYFFNIRAVLVSRALIEGLKQHTGGVTENLNYYKQAYALETIGTQELGEQSIQSALTVALAPQIPQETKMQFVSFAEEAMRREIKRAPNDARLRMFLGGFYNRLGNFNGAEEELKKAHELSPNKQTIAFEFANTYMSTSRYAEALTLLKEAFELAPEFQKARNAYAVSALYTRDFSLADALIASSTEPQGVLVDEQILKAFVVAKRFDKAIALLQLRLEKQPDNPQTHISLAAVYLANGERGKAVFELQRTIELNPAFKEQGEYYVREIQAGRNP